MKDLPTIKIGNSQQVRPGQWVVALGHPWGVTGATTAGMVIGVGRPVENLPFDGDLIQVGLHLRPGHSGGPMVDSDGRLVGILTRRDLRFLEDREAAIAGVMTGRENLVTAPAETIQYSYMGSALATPTGDRWALDYPHKTAISRGSILCQIYCGLRQCKYMFCIYNY